MHIYSGKPKEKQCKQTLGPSNPGWSANSKDNSLSADRKKRRRSRCSGAACCAAIVYISLMSDTRFE